MQYPVIVEQKNGLWRAVIPTLADLSVEGTSLDEALRNARQAAEVYLSNVVVTTIEVEAPAPLKARNGERAAALSPGYGEVESLNYPTAEQWACAASLYPQNPNDPIYQQYLTALAAEKKRQRTRREMDREADFSEGA